MGMIKAAIGDAVLTSIWVFNLPLLGILTAKIANSLGFQGQFSLPGLFITTILATIRVWIFSLLGSALGGASFNPSTSLSFHAAGLGPNSSLITMALRFPAQAAGGVFGVKAIMQLMPTKHQHMLNGPSLKVDLHTGAIAEGVLTFMFCLALLLVMLKGPKNPLLKMWFLALATVGLVLVGSGYTGPSMNPANAMGWAYLKNWHNSWEFYYVYWICPFVGAILAAWVFRFLFAATIKQKEA